jgi:hypothetical protein
MEKGFNPMTILKQFDRNGDGKITQGFFILNLSSQLVYSIKKVNN